MSRFLLHLTRIAACLLAVAAGAWMGEMQLGAPPPPRSAVPRKAAVATSGAPRQATPRHPVAASSPRSARPPASADLPPAPCYPDPAEEARLADIDARAADAPTSVTGSIPALARWLVAPARGDRQKARVLFTWIARNVRYTAEVDPTRPPPQRAEQVLQERTAICAGYAKLFKAMADEVGLEAEVVTGYGRTPASGDGPYGPLDLHAWNAVRIDGRWQLLDPTWAAGAQVDGRWQARFEPFWFLTPPAMFVYTHLPSDPDWQLLARPLDADAQRRLPVLTGVAWANGLAFDATSSRFDAFDGTAVLRFQAPEDVRFRAILGPATSSRDELREPIPGTVLDARKGEQCESRVACPGAGRFRLDLYVGSAADEKHELSLAGTWVVDAARGADSPLVLNKGNALPRGAWIAPASQHLAPGRSHRFEAHVPYSKGVFVKVGEQVHRLDGTWPDFAGDVEVGDGPVQLCAEADGGRYYVIAEYAVR